MACLSKTIGKFTLDSYRILAKSAPEENIIYSPANIATVMGMVELGARGKTREEISKVMHFGSPDNTSKGGASHESCKAADIHKEFKELLSTLNTCKTHYDLNLANGLFGQKGFEYEEDYVSDTKKFYNAKLEEVDFKKDTEKARQTINVWVDNQTNEPTSAGTSRFAKNGAIEWYLSWQFIGKIKDLFAKDSISTATVLALACAIHFQGKWKFPFKTEDTVDDTFHLNTNETKSVKMMTQTSRFKMNTVEKMKCKIIELPYDKEVSMLVLLPDDINGLAQVSRNMDSLSASNGTFALNLFQRLSEDNKSNLFFSPFSVSSALAMVFLGTKGNTAAQMSQVLQFDKAKALHTDFQTLISDINKPGMDYLLRTANRLYGEKSFTFLDEFLGSTKKYYHADLQSVDFCTKAEECRKEINTWVEQKTEGKIQDLLPSGSVDALTRLVLVNAIYFKGNWANQFDKQATKEMPFRINKNDTKPVQMMYKKAKYQMTYIPDLLTKVIELPYVNNELSMLILLPDDIEDSTTGLEKLESALTYENFVQWTSPEMMNPTQMRLHFPKFKLEDSFELKSVLACMGMSDAFDQGKADFSAMSANNELVLSKVIHKSYVEVNEEGTEAAAATAGIMMMRCMPIEPTIVCDHPFLFLIMHTQSRHILFCGRYASP
uniref:Leukocyte elastase inhibitor n=1 Tax=Leptobrachium leishanense TaxID=445787 RepID=A0A8C5MJL7_9ANUR